MKSCVFPFVTISMQLVLSDLVGKSLNLQVLPCKRHMQDKQTNFKTEPKWFVLVRRTRMVWSVLDRIPGKRVVWSVLGWNWTKQALCFAHSNSVEDTLQKVMSCLWKSLQLCPEKG